MHNAITDVTEVKVGHYTDRKGATGCTVILCEQGAVAGVDVRGAAPGTRETDLLRPMNLVQKVHAIVLSGGSAFGLDAACGVMRYLEERGYGYEMGNVRVPIVPAAILFDLGIGSATTRPGAEDGYRACLEAHDSAVAEGSVGAGTGATVGKLLGMERATKAGLGTASQKIGPDVVVAALVAVNAFGDVIDPESGRTLAGPRQVEGKGFISTSEALKSMISKPTPLPTNTVLGVVATNASLDKEQANKIAHMAHDGLARAVKPAHTMYDGDVIFALSTGGGRSTDITTLGAVAADLVATSIVRAITQAQSLCGIPAAREVT